MYTVLIVVVVGAITGTGWYVWQSRTKANNLYDSGTLHNTTGTTTAQPSAYKRTTTVPSDWIVYSNAKYSISFSYPKSWSVISGTNGDPSSYIYEIGMGPYQQTYIAMIGVNKNTLSDNVTILKKNYTVLADSKLIIDGHSAEMIRYKNGSGSERQYYISSNGYTYTLPTVYENDSMTGGGGMSAKDSLILFESVKII